MSISDGQRANATNFNAAFISKTALSQDIDGTINLNNSSSGADVTNVQQEINNIKTSITSINATDDLLDTRLTDIETNGAPSSLYASPDDYGAVGDGTTDDTTAVTSALASGRPVSGIAGKTYAVSGNITLPSDTHLVNIKFKQLSPGSTTRRTLYQSSGNSCYMKNVYVNRNGTGLGGLIGSSAGIYIDSCSNLILEDVEVTGDDLGDGIIIISCDHARIIRPYVHDMNYGSSSMTAPTDDVMHGIFIFGGSGWVLDSPRVVNLKGEWTSQSSIARWTRGVAVGGASDFTINSPSVEVVDQGVDITGSDNPTRFSVNGGSAIDCYTYGFKAANTVTMGSFVGCSSIRAGFCGFVASAPNDTLTTRTSRIEFIGCHAEATGSNGAYSTTVSGFRVMSSTLYPHEPLAVKFIGCYADGTGGNMNYGFYSDVSYNTSSSWNTVTDCESTGATTLQISGFQQGFVKMNISSNQSIPNNTATTVALNTAVIDRMSGADTTNNRINATSTGFGTLTGTIAFAGNATGTRIIYFFRNGTFIDGATVRINAVDTATKNLTLSIPVLIDPGDYFTMQAYQDSGGALNILATQTTLSLVYHNFGRGRS